MAKLLQRLRSLLSSPVVPFRFLDLPLELRRKIYTYIAPSAFLLSVPHAHYIGLLYSCKQIQEEMASESLRQAPAILTDIQGDELTHLFKFRPLHPLDFASLTHLTLSIPRWILFEPSQLFSLFASLVPVLALHLNSLTMGLSDLGPDELDFHIMDVNIGRFGFDGFTTALMNRAQGSVSDDYYDLHTTYSHIVGFATAINCLLAPDLCYGNHSRDNPWCFRHVGTRPVKVPEMECNVRRIDLCFKNLDEEDAETLRSVYIFLLVPRPMGPMWESDLLKKRGWTCRAEEMMIRRKNTGVRNRDLFAGYWVESVRFVWDKMEKKTFRGYRKVDRRLLKGVGKA
jgi:hypothetical protein